MSGNQEDMGVAASQPGRQPSASAAGASSQSGTPNAADREAANKAFDIAFRGNTSSIDDDMAALLAAHRQLGEQRAIARLVDMANNVAWQAGVGGRETAGAIASYLATSPAEIVPFVDGRLSPCDFVGDWVRGGCLTWHAQNGEVVAPGRPNPENSDV